VEPALQALRKRGGKGLFPLSEIPQEDFDGLRDGNEVSPDVTGQGLDESRHPFFEKSRHGPLKGPGLEAGERTGRQLEGHPVGGIARAEPVAQRQRQPARGEDIGEERELPGVGRLPEHVLLGHPEKRVASPVADQPLQGPNVEDVPEALLVEGGQDIVRCKQGAPPEPVFHIPHPIDEIAIVREECRWPVDLCRHEGLADEHLCRLPGVDAAVGHAARLDDDEAVEADALGGRHLAAPAVPPGIEVRGTAEAAAEGLEPVPVDIGGRAGKELGRLHDLRRHDPVAAAVVEAGTGKDHDPAASRSVVDVLFLFHGDVREVAAQHRAVDPAVPVLGVAAGCPSPWLFPSPGGFLLDDLPDLVVDVAPLPHPSEGEEVVPAEPPEPARGPCARRIFDEAFPEGQQGEEVRQGAHERGPGGVGLLLLSGRPLPWVLGA